MVKPNTTDHVEPFDSSLTANNHNKHFGKPHDDGKIPVSEGNRRWSDEEDKVLNELFDMRTECGVEVDGISSEKDDLDETQRQMLLSEEFKSIRGNHRPQQPGGSLYHHGQVSETIHGVNIREPSPETYTFEDYNIQTVDSGSIQKLENLEKRHHNIRDPPKLVNVKLLEEVGSLGRGADAECVLYKEKNTGKSIVHKKMIFNPSCVYEYVMQTSFPLDVYSMALRTLLLNMLEGCPGRRLSAADAHKEIVKLRRSTAFETLNAEETKDNHGIDIVKHTASVYPETVPNIEEKVDYVPDCVTSQGETDSLPPRVTGDGYNQTFPDFLLSLASSEQGTTAPIYATGVGLPYQTCQQTKYTPPRGTEPPETIMPDRSIWQSSINEPIHTGIFPPSEVSMSIQQSQEILVDDALYGYSQENFLDLVPVNQVAGTTAVPEGYPHTAVHEGHQQTAVHEGCPQATVPEGRPQNIVHEDSPLISIPEGRQQTVVHEGCPQTTVPEGRIHNAVPEDSPLITVPEICLQTAILEGRPHIPNQEQLLLIQNSRANSTQNTNVSYGKGIINLKLGGSQLQEDGQDVTNPACPDKTPEPPAKPETMDKLKYRLQTGARKRCCPVLPNEYTNIPNLDLIHCKKKRREND